MNVRFMLMMNVGVTCLHVYTPSGKNECSVHAGCNSTSMSTHLHTQVITRNCFSRALSVDSFSCSDGRFGEYASLVVL